LVNIAEEEHIEIEEKALPSAIIVKQQILDIRLNVVREMMNIKYRMRMNKDISDEKAKLEGYILGLYQLLRDYFKPKEKSETEKLEILKEYFFNGKSLKLEVLYELFEILTKKMDVLGITHIELEVENPNEAVLKGWLKR